MRRWHRLKTRRQVKFRYVGDGDRDGDCIGEAAIGDGDGYRIDGFGFVVQCRLGLQLAGRGLNVKRRRIGAAEGVGEHVIVRVRGGYGRADIDAGRDIFRD